MSTDEIFVELLNNLGASKHNAPTGDLARYYAIVFTDIEKAYAFYLTYLYPHEADIPPAQEIQ